MSAPDLRTEAGLAGGYPSNRFNQRERKLLESVADALDSLSITSGMLATGSVTTTKIAADAVDNTKLADNSVSLEQLDSGIEMTHRIMAATSYQTVGSSATEVLTLSGVQVGDLILAQMSTLGLSPVTIKTATASGANQVTIEFSADPTNDHVLSIIAVRAAS